MINESFFRTRQQYLAIKNQYPDALLLFRTGDYCEAFDGDAKTVATVNGVAITSAEVAPGVRVPAVGVPIYDQRGEFERGKESQPTSVVG